MAMDADDSDGFVEDGFVDAEVICAEGSAPVGCERTLALAAWKGKLPDVQHLLKQKADPNALANHADDSYTPLIAAAANGNVAVVEMLLLAGADPGLLAPSKVSAADLATNPAVTKLLAIFSAEVEVELKKPSVLAKDPKEGRRSALRAVRARGKALVERVLGRSALQCQLAHEGDDAVTGEEARRQRKQRREQEEAARQRRLAERVAERRGQTDEEREAARLQRVAARAAARRGLSDEDIRLQRVQQKAAARRRSRQDLPSSPTTEAPPLAITANGEEEVELEQVEQATDRQEADPPRVVRKSVELQAINCIGCGVSGQPRRCGLCGGMGVCGFCSTCGLCGHASGFHKSPSIHMVPGVNTTSGDPRLSGLQLPDKGKKRRRKRSRAGSSSGSRDVPDSEEGGEACESGGEEEQAAAAAGGGEAARRRAAAPPAASRSRSPAAGRAGGNDEEFLADNHGLNAKSQGLAYRFSRDLTDTVYDNRNFAAWGKYVSGVDMGDGWLKVGSLYLPMVLNGKRVLIPKAEAAAASPARQPATPP